MQQPKCDMRGINLVDGMYFSRKNLCEHCGRLTVCTIAGKATRCGGFIPTLPFRDMIGTKTGFSTFRLGPAWSKRVVVGSIIGLYSLKTQRIEGFASVGVMHTGERDKLLRAHADTNHAMLFMAYGSRDEMVQRFEKLLRRTYGNMIYDHYDDATVLYLQRVQLEDVLRHSPEDRWHTE